MKNSLGLAAHYIKYYKYKSLSILFSIILAVALIAGIGTLYNSANHANVEKVRMETADYHFKFNVNQTQYKILAESANIDKIAVTKYADSANEPNMINFMQADKNYIDMCNSKVLAGRMPLKKNEIALERWVMNNFNIEPIIGEMVTFKLIQANKSETFTLVGILEDIPKNKKDGKMEGYIALTESEKKLEVYVKFGEQQDIKKQMNQLRVKANIENKEIQVNRELLDAMNVYTYIPPAGSEGSVRYLINQYHLDLVGALFVISLFSCFVINSVFNISTLQRISDYGLIEALGADSSKIFTILISELMILFLIGFPFGTLVGILSAKLLNHRFSSVLIGQVVKSGEIYVSAKYIFIGALFLLILLFYIALRMMKKLNKFTPIEAIQKQYKQQLSGSTRKRLCTLGRGSITKKISFKYISKNKLAFVRILLSLSLGGAVFICSDYGAELKKENNELETKVSFDLNSDYQMNMQNTDFDEGVSSEMITKLEKINGVDQVSPISYYFGGIVIDDNRMLSKNLWDSYNKNEYIQNSFGGMYTKINDGSNNYLLKTGIYGYDDHMLNVLKDYLLEGEIDIQKMKEQNLVLFKQIQDGGNGLYDLIDVKPGDTITIKYQKSPKISANALRFENGSEYVERDYVVGATLKRVAATNDNFIGDSGEDIIMTNDQFQKDFGIHAYNMVSITKKEGEDHSVVANEINEVVKDISHCFIRDLTIEIAQNNAFVDKQLMFLYGVTFILFMISLFNILNNISYNVLSRINEFGVLRAMGITDSGFWKMIIDEGLFYGAAASAVTIIGALLGQVAVLFMVKIGYLYINPHFTINLWKYFMIILLNMIIAIVATVIPSRKIVKMSIIEEIKRQE